jgi:hypothetical protein
VTVKPLSLMVEAGLQPLLPFWKMTFACFSIHGSDGRSWNSAVKTTFAPLPSLPGVEIVRF